MCNFGRSCGEIGVCCLWGRRFVDGKICIVVGGKVYIDDNG